MDGAGPEILSLLYAMPNQLRPPSRTIGCRSRESRRSGKEDPMRTSLEHGCVSERASLRSSQWEILYDLDRSMSMTQFSSLLLLQSP